jgi:hypothetical protein
VAAVHFLEQVFGLNGDLLPDRSSQVEFALGCFLAVFVGPGVVRESAGEENVHYDRNRPDLVEGLALELALKNEGKSVTSRTSLTRF